MPIYEYTCNGGHHFEELRSMEERNNAACPMCEKPSRREFSLPTILKSETFRVVDSDGNVTQEKQALKSIPDWQDTKPIEYQGTPKPLISRSGNVYYPRKQKNNATV